MQKNKKYVHAIMISIFDLNTREIVGFVLQSLIDTVY